MRLHSRAGAIKFVLATYSEFSLVALLTLFFTTTARVQTLADSSIAFIVISYSTFLALGFHNGAIRDGAICPGAKEKDDILRLELYFSAFIAIVLFFSAFIARSNFYLMAGLFIGAVNHLKTACQTVFRLRAMDTLLNILNVAWASIFFISFSLFSWLSGGIALEVRFFSAWAGSAAFVVCSFYIFCLFLLRPIRPLFYLKGELFFQILRSSKYMFLMASGLVVLLTSDRLVLNTLGAAENIIADFQYVDVLTNVYFLGMTSVLYYFTPDLLKQFSKYDESHHDAFTSMVTKYLGYLLWIALAFMFLITIFLLAVHRFSWMLQGVLLSMLTVKTLLICLGLVCNFYLAQRQERILAAAYLGLTMCGISMSFLYAYVLMDSAMLVSLPLLNAGLVGVVIIYLLKGISLRAKHEKNTVIN